MTEKETIAKGTIRKYCLNKPQHSGKLSLAHNQPLPSPRNPFCVHYVKREGSVHLPLCLLFSVVNTVISKLITVSMPP